MNKNRIEKYIEIIREMITVGNTGYQSGGDQTKAGFDPTMSSVKRRKYLKSAPRKPWLEFLKQTQNGRRS